MPEDLPQTNSEPDQEPAEQPVELEPLPDPEGSDGEYSIAQTMIYAHDNRLFRKLFTLPVAPDVGERIKVLYAGLPKQNPPKGDAEAWTKRASELVDSAERLIDGDAEAMRAYKKAVNCNSCHSTFRSP